MNRTDRLAHCADSQALEVFLGAYLAYQGWRHRSGAPILTCVLAAAGLVGMIAALQGPCGPRRWTCAVMTLAAVFLATGEGAILVALASAWAWYRSMLDDKVTP